MYHHHHPHLKIIQLHQISCQNKQFHIFILTFLSPELCISTGFLTLRALGSSGIVPTVRKPDDSANLLTLTGIDPTIKTLSESVVDTAETEVPPQVTVVSFCSGDIASELKRRTSSSAGFPFATFETLLSEVYVPLSSASPENYTTPPNIVSKQTIPHFYFNLS